MANLTSLTSPGFFWGSCYLFFGFLCCVMCAVFWLSFSFLAMALPVCFRFMSLTVPLVSFVPLLQTLIIVFHVHRKYAFDYIFTMVDSNNYHIMLVSSF